MRQKKTTIGRKWIGRPAWSSVVRALIAVIMLLAAGCSGDASEGNMAGAKRPVAAMPVTVAQAVQKPMPVMLQAVGTVDAYATVTVKSQVEGELTAVHLREGQCVDTGDLLFTIDPRSFQVRLKQAQAALARDKAQLENARTLLERNAAVVAKGYVSQEQYDQAAANARGLEATVQVDEAAVEDAQIQLASQADAVVIPSQAVQSGQHGSYVFVLKPDKTVELRQVMVDRTVEGQAVIAQGLQAGDSVVTDGQLRLFPGAVVKIVSAWWPIACCRSTSCPTWISPPCR